MVPHFVVDCRFSRQLLDLPLNMSETGGRANRSFDAVLFDWCGTLVEYPTVHDRFRPVLQRLGRPHDEDSIAELVAAFHKAQQHPDVRKFDGQCDLSAENHRRTKLLTCHLGGE